MNQAKNVVDFYDTAQNTCNQLREMDKAGAPITESYEVAARAVRQLNALFFGKDTTTGGPILPASDRVRERDTERPREI